jgi:hypothetical protein
MIRKAFLFFLFGSMLAFGQSDNMIHVNAFPGADVGTKVANAQLSCNPNTLIPCYIVIDASLAAYRPGTLPTLCSQCVLQDWRTGGNAQTLKAQTIMSSLSPVVNVLAYGADNTGTVDSSAAVTSALKAACNAYSSYSPTTIPPVFFPPGHYLVENINIAAISGGLCQPYLYSLNDNAATLIYNGSGKYGDYILRFGRASFGGVYGLNFDGKNQTSGVLATYGLTITTGIIDNNFWIFRSRFSDFLSHAIYDSYGKALNTHFDYVRFDTVGGCGVYIKGTVGGSGGAPFS